MPGKDTRFIGGTRINFKCFNPRKELTFTCKTQVTLRTIGTLYVARALPLILIDSLKISSPNSRRNLTEEYRPHESAEVVQLNPAGFF